MKQQDTRSDLGEQRDAYKVVGSKPRQFRAPKAPKPPKDIADLLDFSADRADEISLSQEGLVGGTALLRRAASEIRRLRSAPAQPNEVSHDSH